MNADLPVHACGMRLLLSGRELFILPDNQAGDEFVPVPLDDLGELARGTVLSKDWVSVTADGEVYEVSCNAAEAEDLEEFLSSLRQRWLGPPFQNAAPKHSAYGVVLDGKFTALLQAELDPGEEVLAQYFDSSQVLSRRRWLRTKPSWTPSHLIAVTSARRVLWITDHYQEYRERTASISRSIPLARVTAIDIADVGAERTLQVRFGRAGCWSVLVRNGNSSSSESFVDAVIGCLS